MKSVFRELPKSVFLVAVATTVVMSGIGMVVPLLPVYGQRLGAGPLELGLLMAGLFAGRLVAQIPAGIATDIFGCRAVLIAALVGYTVTCLGYAGASDPTQLIIYRLLQGLSAGFFSVAARALISELGGPRQRGTAQGFYSSAVNLGFVIGPVTAGLIIAADLPISTPFLASAGLSGVSLVAFLFIREPVVRRPSYPPSKPRGATPSLAAKRSELFLLAAANLCFMAGLSTIMTLFPIAAVSEIPGGLKFVGTTFSIAGVSGLLFGPITGRLSDHLGRPPLLILGALLATCEGLVLFLTRDPWLIAAGFFLGGAGIACFFNALYAALGDRTTRARLGRATGMIGLAGEGGGIAGSLLAPLLWHASDLQMPFGLQIVCIVPVILVGLYLWRRGPQRSTVRTRIREVSFPG